VTAGSFGGVGPTAADRDAVLAILERARADGRLSQESFDERSAQVPGAQTHDELGALLAGLQDPRSGPLRSVRTNRLAAAALVCGICGVVLPIAASIAAIILGIAARGQIRRTGESGAGMALAGIILGCIGIALAVLVVIVILVILSAVARACNQGC
jgi:Domain of unknown function (DUF4190)/Domain of unknown function (DUF1707)